jgi:hypothetical protein
MKFEPGDLARITSGDFGRLIPPVIIVGPSEEFNGWFRVYFPTLFTYGDWPRSGLRRLQNKEEA